MRKWTRRAFIGAGTLVGGGFVLGVGGIAFSPSRHSVLGDEGAGAEQLTTWILITPDNIVTVLVPHCEMGQGSQTALAMMAAEEMNADWNLVRVKEAPALGAYANAYMAPRVHGRLDPGPARPRIRLRNLSPRPVVRPAADRRIVRGSGHRCLRDDGRRRSRAGNAPRRRRRAVRRARGRVQGRQLARRARSIREERDVRRARGRRGQAVRALAAGDEGSGELHHPPDGAPALRHPHRRSTAARSTASISARRACCSAAVEMAPVSGGKLLSVDAAAAEAMPGVKRVVRLENAVAVVADTYWHARKAIGALEPKFDDAGHGEVSTASIFAAFDTRARRAAGIARHGARRSSRPTTRCRSWRTRRWSRWSARCGSRATTPTCGPACRIRSTRARPRRRRSVSTPNRCVSPTCSSAAGSAGVCPSISTTSISPRGSRRRCRRLR